MRREVDRERLRTFLKRLGEAAQGPGRVYLTGGATAILHGWRGMTKDVDLEFDPEPPGVFEAIAHLKDDLDLNVELASPRDFVPPLPGWEGRAIFVVRHGLLDVYHFDPYSQALAKLDRGHDRDLRDVEEMVRIDLIERSTLRDLFERLEPTQLLRYPAIDVDGLAAKVHRFVTGASPPCDP